MQDQIKLFSPATVANLACGFDVLGMALDSVGDEMIIKKSKNKGISISKIVGQDLPIEATKNVAGVAALELYKELEVDYGFEIQIFKNIKPGSGIGSSAASAAGAVWGMNELLGKPFSPNELVAFAMEGERLASGNAHADNVAPALFGGFTLVRSYKPLEVIKLACPEELYAVVIHPQIELKTADSRKILKPTISLRDGVTHWGNVGGLVAGLYTNNYKLIGDCLKDVIAEPQRADLIPHYYELKHQVIKSGALGVGISGSGPSIFALTKGKKIAKGVAKTMQTVYQNIGVDFDIHISKVNQKGIYKID
ncbi:homoserine kinase [Pseudofulvibacter geojedonensis]|uniref:Homoserine kinase n=1 Tax=Pseudofulvibacter geojedonensis TaxID=1123758 RepID=A0ABW3I335_9FLAO